MTIRLTNIAPILRCPRTGAPLRLSADELISDSGEHYPIVNGKPILVRQIEPIHLNAPAESVISRNIETYSPPPDIPTDGIVINLGSGDVPSADPRVISVDVLPTQNVDIVAEAEALPFQTCSIDFISSGAVFEHLHDPLASASEVRRVLKEGGRFYIDTAFLQSYHGFPGHYFNMTPQAIETFLVDSFILEHAQTPDSGTVLHSVVALFDRLLLNLPSHERDRLNALSLAEVLNEIRHDQTRGNPLISDLSEHLHRAMAASFVVVGRKPLGHDNQDFKDKNAAILRRNYYTERNNVIHQHGEACYYARISNERGASIDEIPIPSLQGLLARGYLDKPTQPTRVLEATEQLKVCTATLLSIRDRWIEKYMSLL